MQTIYLDISNRGVIPVIYAKQNDVGRKVEVVLTNSGLPYEPEAGSAFSAWYSGASGMGNYTDIGGKSAFAVSGNKVTVELITQMLQNGGEGFLCLVLSRANGEQIGLWNIRYICEGIPGAGSEPAKDYYTAFSQAVAGLAYPDVSLSVAGKAADAAAVGAALAGKAPAGIVSKTFRITSESELDNALTEEINTMANDSVRFLVFSPTNSAVFGGISTLCRLYKRSDSGYGTADFIGHATYGPNVWHKSWYGGVWQPLEWDNPPMIPGVEYRTTERFDGKPVYAKRIYFGYLPNKTTANVSHGISGKAWNVRYSIDTNWTNQFLGVYPAVSAVYADSTNISIATNSDMSTIVVYFTLWYTKD